MTVGEVARYIKGFVFRQDLQRKERAYFDYTLATLIGHTTVGQMSKGNRIPTLEETYPDLFNDEKTQELKQQKKMEASTARFIQFANAFNAKKNIGEDK